MLTVAEPIVTREQIAAQADAAARKYARRECSEPPPNPYPLISDAAAAYAASFERALLWHTAPEAEGSA